MHQQTHYLPLRVFLLALLLLNQFGSFRDMCLKCNDGNHGIDCELGGKTDGNQRIGCNSKCLSLNSDGMDDYKERKIESAD